MKEHNWKTVLEMTPPPKAPKKLKNAVLCSLEQLPDSKPQSVSKGISLSMIIGVFFSLIFLISMKPFLSGLAVFDLFGGIQPTTIQLETLNMVLGTLVFWSSIDHYLSTE